MSVGEDVTEPCVDPPVAGDVDQDLEKFLGHRTVHRHTDVDNPFPKCP